MNGLYAVMTAAIALADLAEQPAIGDELMRVKRDLTKLSVPDGAAIDERGDRR